MTLAANLFLTGYVYTRLPQQSAWLFRAAPSGQFDIWHHWSETGASLLMGTIVTVLGDTWWSKSANLLHYWLYILPIPKKYCASLTGEVLNMFWKRMVTWSIVIRPLLMKILSQLGGWLLVGYWVGRHLTHKILGKSYRIRRGISTTGAYSLK